MKRDWRQTENSRAMRWREAVFSGLKGAGLVVLLFVIVHFLTGHDFKWDWKSWFYTPGLFGMQGGQVIRSFCGKMPLAAERWVERKGMIIIGGIFLFCTLRKYWKIWRERMENKEC
ncbi:MAG: hypothetical protein J6Z35_00015 [Lachnospiraceae bacterium]|nr:hypothetical protein [Lachnospiraceae bacterium]